MREPEKLTGANREDSVRVKMFQVRRFEKEVWRDVNAQELYKA